MKTWGRRNFENDQAAGFAKMLFDKRCSAGEVFTVINAVAEIVNREDPECGPDIYDSTMALAGIEFVAAAKNKFSIDFPASGKQWLLRNDPLSVKIGGFLGIGSRKIDMQSLSIQAIFQIRANSELKDFWEESAHFEDWLTVLNDLESRIDNK